MALGPPALNLATGRSVVTATTRGARPHDAPDSARRATVCPFCPGNEALLPDIVMARSSVAPPGWSTRVVPNRYPILQPDDNTMPGRHEVVVETPAHHGPLTPDQQTGVVLTWQARHRVLSRDWPHVLIYRNHGERAGQSLSHPHSQIAAFQGSAPGLSARDRLLFEHHRTTGRCLIDDLARDEDRTVRRQGGFTAIVPEQSEQRCELWILPVGASPDFETLTEADAISFARLLDDLGRRVEHVLGQTDYNLTILTPCAESRGAPHWRWFACLQPRVATVGGFELATGLAVGAGTSLSDAAVLRDAVPV